MPTNETGSLTKEPPLAKLDATLALIQPGMRYDELLAAARNQTHKDAPGLLKSRFLLVDSSGSIIYDRFLSIVKAYGINTPLVRKVMYFTWAWRDQRLRRFISEQVATRDGRWSPQRLTDKSRSQFFEEWFAPSTAAKARSNIEFFLVETGIFDPRTTRVALGLEDGWLAEAMLVAAQHEPDQQLRLLMPMDPIGALAKLQLNALANLPDPGHVVTLQPLADLTQLQLDGSEAREYAPPTGKTWQVRERAPLKRSSTRMLVDLVALERANASHLRLERATAKVLGNVGMEAKCSEAVDMYSAFAEGHIIFEMKSCHEGNIHSQVRRGLSQLLEYRYAYRAELRNIIAMVLVIEIEPPQQKRWLVAFLESVGVTLAWPDAGNQRLITSASIPLSLAGIVHAH